MMGLLKHNVQLDNGLIAQDVYYKIKSFQGDNNFINYNINAYASKEAADIGSPVLFTRLYSFPYIATDIIGNGYTQLKTTDEFKDAEDLLEDGQTV